LVAVAAELVLLQIHIKQVRQAAVAVVVHLIVQEQIQYQVAAALLVKEIQEAPVLLQHPGAVVVVVAQVALEYLQ
jgi:hypothetical protein